MAAATLEDFLAPLGDVRSVGKTNQILLVSYFLRTQGQAQFSVTGLKQTFRAGGLPPPDAFDLRVRNLTNGANARLIRVGRQFALSLHGAREVTDYLTDKHGTSNASRILENLIDKLSEDGQKKFVAEALVCLRAGARRAAVTMMWLLTIDHLYEFILRHKLAEFNAGMTDAFDRGARQIAAKDDFGDIKEVNFIAALRTARIISNDIRKILDEKLGIRNTCAHPSTVEVHDSKVVNFVEDLADNVILKFAL